MTFAVAGHVIGVVITSSPGPTPSATSARCMAAVPEETASACSAPTAGGWNESMVARLADSSGTGRPEAYESGGRHRPLEGLLPALADRLYRSDAIGSPPEFADLEPRPAVDADADHALDAFSLLDALDRFQLAGLRGQEDGRGASNLRLGAELPHRLAQRGGEGEPVQVEAESGLAELGVVPAAETRRDLDHLRPVGGDAELRIRRAALDPERLDRASRNLGRLAGGISVRWPDMSERDSEGRRGSPQPVGHGQRVGNAVDGERLNGHFGPVDELLDDGVAVARLVERAQDRRRKSRRLLDEAESALALPVGRLDDAWDG